MKLWHPPFSQGIKAFKSAAAFTLVELSIVIVIIGLIIGGVTAGMSLVRSAQLRGIMSEYNQYSTAFSTFKLQYNALPGDISNAFSYWPSCGGANAANCNGDSNREIFHQPSSASTDETFAVWEHLALAGLIPGKYPGVPAAASNYMTRAVDVPATSYNKGMWSVSTDNWSAWTTPIGIYKKNIYFLCGYEDPSQNLSLPVERLLTVADMAGIDNKLDDGYPQNGRVLVLNGGEALIGSGVTATYNFAQTGAHFAILFAY